MEAIPELRAYIPRVPEACPQWRPITDHWDELTALLREEEATRRDIMASRTHQRMKELLEALEEEHA